MRYPVLLLVVVALALLLWRGARRDAPPIPATPVVSLPVELAPTQPGETPRVELAGIGAVLAARGDAGVAEIVVPRRRLRA